MSDPATGGVSSSVQLHRVKILVAMGFLIYILCSLWPLHGSPP
jgi:hypothetical protein